MIIYSLLISLLLFLLTYILLRLFIHNAHRVGLIDIPNERSSHKVPVPRGAGIIFGLVFLVGILILKYSSLENINYLYAFLSLLIVYAVGLYDDIYNITFKKKFIFIIIAALIAYYDGFVINSLGNYFGYELYLGYFSVVFTIFAIVGFTNAINLTDGLDGLAGSIAIVMSTGLMFIGLIYEDNILICIPMLLIAPIAAFLMFNWYPAKVFMGDSGSLFLGFTLSLLSIYSLQYINTVSILFLAAIPLLDTLIVMRRRKQRKQSMFVADKNHLHHVILNFKQDKLFTVNTLIIIQVIFTIIFIQVHVESDFINLFLFILLFVIFFKSFDPRAIYRQEKKKTEEIEGLVDEIIHK